MVSSSEKECVEAAVGFPSRTPVSTLLSISHIFGATKNRCGIYLLAFPSDLFYIGQAVDVVRRFSQHRKNYDDISGFSFISVPKNELNDVEKSLIFKAESLGVKLKNAVHVSSITGETDFDLIVPESEQNAWFASASRFDDSENTSPIIQLPDSQQLRFSKNFEQFTKHQFAQSALGILKRYILECIPTPRTSEYSFWSVSCMPSTNKNTAPRLFCVSAASMELLVVGFWKKSKTPWSFVTVDAKVLEEHWPDPDELLKKFPFAEWEESSYRDAGQNQIRFRCENYEDMKTLLSDHGFCQAAAALSLRVMRKRPNFYSQYHCAQLSNLAFTK